MHQEKIFKPAKADGFSKGITIVIFVMMFVFLLLAGIDQSYFWPGIITAGILFITMMISLTLRPKEYILKDDNLLIKKHFNHISKIENIKKAEKVTAGGIRTFGVGGLFGYTGWFNGNQEWFVTDRKKGILLESDRKAFVISPENPDEFLQDLNLKKECIHKEQINH